VKINSGRDLIIIIKLIQGPKCKILGAKYNYEKVWGCFYKTVGLKINKIKERGFSAKLQDLLEFLRL
jgi:hypothetical protein